MGRGEEVAEQLNSATMDRFPDELLIKILSFLPTKQAVSTSVLSKRWRVLFASTHNFGFDTYIFCHPRSNKRYKYETSEVMRKRFNDFVDRTLALQSQGGKDINKFSLELGKRYNAEQGDIDRMICYALEHGVSDLHLRITPTLLPEFSIPSKVFTSTTLVKLSLDVTIYDCPSVPPDTSLPALKVLVLDSVWFKDDQLSNVFLPACPALEDLTIRYPYKAHSIVISSKTIKKLSVTLCRYGGNDDVSRIISFDTPNVVDFYYSGYLRHESPQYHFKSSLTKTTLNLHFFNDHKTANVRDLINAICNVKTLHLTSSAVEVMSVCCKGELPTFNNLVDLVFFSGKKEGWELLLPRLLHCSPNLKTLVLQGLDCFACRRRRSFTSIPMNNRINVLRIVEYKGYVAEMKHIGHFLLKMECLEVLKVHVSPTMDMDDTKKKQLTEDMLTLPAASSKLKIQVM